MKKDKIFFIFIFFAFNIFPKETIMWYKVPFPPLVITEGSFKNKGTDDLIFEYYKKKLVEYEHETELVSLNRLLGLAKEQNNFGALQLIKSAEREEFLYFTIPYDFTLSNHLIIKKDNLKIFQAYIDDKGYIDIEKVFKNENITFGLVAGRVYHTTLTPLINEKRNLDITHGLNNQEIILKKLATDRINATIEYPEVTEFILKEKKIDLEYLVIPIKGLDAYTPIRFSFPKNKWGLKITNELNGIIKEFIKTKEFENMTLKWSPEKIKYLKEFRAEKY